MTLDLHNPPAPAAAPALEPPSAPEPPAARPRRRRRRWLVASVIGVVLIGLVLAIVLRSAGPPAPAPPAAEPASAPRLTAHGQVRPWRGARIGTLTGGVVTGLAVEVGQRVGDKQELGRVRAPSGEVEVLVAPYAGTVTGILVRDGDTVLAGTTVATVADLSRLLIETTDVDEYLISRLRPDQSVTVTIDALDRRELRGHVRSVALEPQTSNTGDAQYPVTIELEGTPSELRAGMSARLTFGD
jgi:multidrug efflux pump subunit AcrA (membrane-fusion protein)